MAAMLKPEDSFSDYSSSSIYETTTREPLQKISTQTMTASTVSRRSSTTQNPTTVTHRTTSKPTTVRQTTTLNPTTVRETTTLNPTTVRETTTSNPTTVRETTTSNPTTVRETTTSKLTKVRQTTTSHLTTFRQTTAANPTMVRETTAANPTTVRETTTSNPTTFRQTTTSKPTTVRQTTTLNPTTVKETTTLNPTTVRETTTSNPTTVRETTTSNPTTVRETTTSKLTKVRQTTTSHPTTFRQTTAANPTTVRETTAANPTTVRETTTSNPTTFRQTTTSKPTTVRQTTTLNPTTVRETTTSKLTTVRQTTTSNPTTVRQTTTSNPTTVKETTTSNPTTVRQTTTSDPTTVRQTTTSNPTTVSQTSNSASTHTTTLSPIKGAIEEILNETITVDNLDIVSVELADVTEDSNKFDVEDLQSVADKLSSIVEFASNQNLTEEAIVQVSVSVIGAVDNILNIPESTFETASSQQVSKTKNILTTISTLTENIQKASSNNFTYSGSNIVLAAVKVDRRKFPLTTAIGGAMDDDIDFSANEGSPSNAAGVTSVSLPEAILPSVSGTNQVISVSVFLLNSPKLFQGDRPSSSSTPSSGDEQNQQPKTVSVVASPILTVTIEGIDIKDLPDNESIVFVFPVNQTLIREENDAEVSQRCVYWDIDLGEWSDEGCRTEKMALEGMVSCRCSHLTSFAVLLDIKGSIISKALDVISRIGCIASIVCLVITLCVLLGFRKLRRKQPQKILINLSFALLALYVTFVIGIDRP
ncbi:cell wall protein DAN4-like, partial [Strongylocentrotus purpuratus]|uniref:GAIN-B domain-containing protein n=1 Tax=Strongylocentrotus purpuratus TaxID=7668 RepID=A0A7M7P3N3_STRPU